MTIKNLYKHICLALIAIIACCAQTNAQTSGNAEVRRGNRYYQDSMYQKAEVKYREALQKDNANGRALYNLGNALLRQGKTQEAYKAYEEATKVEKNDFIKSKAFHNMGVIFQSQQKYKEAIEQYKSSLRLNPADDETRYNLVLCQKMQDKNPQNDNQQKQQKNQQQNRQDNSDQQNQQSEQQQQKGQSMSEDNVEQLLRMVQQSEKDVQRKMNQRKEMPGSNKYQKQW